MNDYDRILGRYAVLKQFRAGWLSTCEEVSRYMCPERGIYNNNSTPKDKKRDEVPEDVIHEAWKALGRLVSIVQSMTASPADKWLQFGVGGKEYQAIGSTRDWLQNVDEITLAANNRSNFYSVSNNVFEDMYAFGTALVSINTDDVVLEDPEPAPFYASYEPGTYCVDVDDVGDLSVVYRDTWMSAIDAVNKWGENCSRALQERAKESPYERVMVTHVVEPNPKYDKKKIDNLSMRYISYYIEAGNGDKKFLSRGGFDEMPYMLVRIENPESKIYARGLGYYALPAIRRLIAFDDLTEFGYNMNLNPPTLYPDEGIVNAPGAVNIVMGNLEEKVPRAFNTTTIDFQGVLGYRQIFKEQINEVFFNDVFLFMTQLKSNVTAYEINTRSDEQFGLLGASFEQIISNFLRPATNYLYRRLEEKRVYPAPPEIVDATMVITPQFVGALAQAQKFRTVNRVNQIAETAAGYAGATGDPGIFDNVDFDKALDVISGIVNVPEGVMRTDQEVEQIRQARQEQLETQQQQAEAAGQAETLRDASEAMRNVSGVV